MESHDNKLAAVDENVSFGLVTISIILVLVLDLLLNGFFLKFIFGFMNKYVHVICICKSNKRSYLTVVII